jgi:hypothetical protein
METENVQVCFANVLWVAFSIPSGSCHSWNTLYTHIYQFVVHIFKTVDAVNIFTKMNTYLTSITSVKIFITCEIWLKTCNDLIPTLLLSAKYSNLYKTDTSVVVFVIEAKGPTLCFSFGGKGSECKRWGFQLEEYRKIKHTCEGRKIPFIEKCL